MPDGFRAIKTIENNDNTYLRSVLNFGLNKSVIVLLW